MTTSKKDKNVKPENTEAVVFIISRVNEEIAKNKMIFDIARRNGRILTERYYGKEKNAVHCLGIATWNTNGLLREMHELEVFLRSEETDICLDFNATHTHWNSILTTPKKQNTMIQA